MNKLQKLAAAGLTDSPEDVAKFYDRFPTQEDFDMWYQSQNQYAMGGITDGIAFPQQPDDSSRRVPYYDKGGFFAPNVMPWNGPIGFYADGGNLYKAQSGREVDPNIAAKFNTGQIGRSEANLLYNPQTGIPYIQGQMLEGPDPMGQNLPTFKRKDPAIDYTDEANELSRTPFKKPPTNSSSSSSNRGGNWFTNLFKRSPSGGARRKHCTVDGCYYFDEGGFTDGIAYPQQPTEHINFSAFPWQPQYNMGGGLPGGPNQSAPCMECGGSMEDGGYMDDQYGGMVDNQMNYFKEGGNWIQKATESIKRRGTEGVCTGSKFGGPSCPPGSKRYNLAKTFRKMAKGKKAYGGVTGTGMDDTDSYVQQMNQDFIDRITPEQPEQMGSQGMPMAYNGYNMPQMANMNMFGYNPMPGFMSNQQSINSPQEWDQNAMMNNRNLNAQNKKLRSAGLGALGAAWSGVMPFIDPSRKYTEHKFTEFKPNTNSSQARYGQELTHFDGTGPSEVPKWDPNDPSKYFDWYFNKRQNSGSTAPKWDPNDPSGYLDWYLNNKRSANNQTKYDYGDWGSWNNVQRSGTGDYTYNTPYGSGAGMAMPAQKYMQDMISGEGSWKDYILAPGSVKENYKGIFKRRPSGREVTFNVYRRTPAGNINQPPVNNNSNIDPNDIEWEKDKKFMPYQKHGGTHNLYRAADGISTPNKIDNMLTALNRENPENPAGTVTYSEQEKRDLSGADLAGGLMVPAAFTNYLATQNKIQQNQNAMPKTADKMVNPMQAGLTGYRGNIDAYGTPFGGTGTTYGMQRGYVKEGGEIYEEGDVLDLTDAQIKRLKDLGYQIEDYTQDDYA